jgi:hypothetical protein
MGIRFYCPNGHKLNVKAFLAGRRGICPHCGAKVQIPAESALAGAAPDPPRQEDHPGNPPLPSTSPLAKGEGGDASSEEVAVVELEPAMPGPLAGGAGQAARGPDRPVPLPHSPPDLLAEAPDAAWYVRPPAGGQFGPANGRTMRQWIEEGRISGDSLVWREGWRDWQEASMTLFKVGSSGPIPEIDTAGSPRGVRGSRGASLHADDGGPPRRESGGMPTWVVGVLTLAVVGLSVALAWVLLR